jgi:hypothetical protein
VSQWLAPFEAGRKRRRATATGLNAEVELPQDHSAADVAAKTSE